MRKLEVIGLLLVLLSAYPLFLMGREVLAQRKAYGLYELRRVVTDVPGFSDDALIAQVGSHRVELRDDFFDRPADRVDRAKAKVGILVDGRDYSHPSEVEIRPFYKDQNRYHSWVKLIRLIERRTATESVAVVQRISAMPPAAREEWDLPKKELRYRILLIFPDGRVSEELFPFEDRARPPYRTMLAKYVTPIGIGFYSEVLQAWPSIPYPILYPWVTAIAGFGIFAIGIARRFSASRGATVH